MDLFEQRRRELTEAEAPLAARMRPRTLDEFVGQDHIVGPGRLLRRAIQADQLSSLILYGPPGTGKTTLARIIANTTKAHFVAINAVLAGVKDIREAIQTAKDQRGLYGKRTILFVDEVHRFNKAQQDALLPWVENGTVILIGATTENPYFEVNTPLVSRSRIFQLTPLTEADLYKIARRALGDAERGYGDLSVRVVPQALDHLVDVANGDARAILNALELAVETTPPDDDGVIHVTLEVAEESIQQRAVLYDKEGDAHFDTISAFIKSLRGSDPDAALYWLARMIYAGEDPRFVFRRMLILASEDVGLADPRAVTVVNACAEAFDRVGMPEGRFHLAQATLYLATAPKSNSVMGFFDALDAVRHEREEEVPTHLKDASRDKEGFGHGQGYLYPHAYREHWVAQQYLPDTLQGQVFYQPSDQGYEAEIRADVARRREAQVAALVDTPREILTYSPGNSSHDRWLQRTLSQAGKQLGTIRDRVFALAEPQRHHVVLDLNAGSGLLTWEALRRVPEGGVYAIAQTRQDAEALREQAEALPALRRPVVRQAELGKVRDVLAQEAPDVRFECIVGRNVLMGEADKAGRLAEIATLLQPKGRIVLAERIPRRTQRLHDLLEPEWLAPALYDRLVQAEAAIYTDDDDPMANWDVDDLVVAYTEAGLRADVQMERLTTEVRITPNLLKGWFVTGSEEGRRTYADRIAVFLSDEEVAHLHHLFTERLRGQSVVWESTVALVWGILLVDTS